MRISGIVSGWMLLFIIPAMAFCQDKVSQPGDFLKLTAPNGMDVLLQLLPNTPSTEITFYLKTGSLYDGDSMAGMANLVGNVIAEKIASCLHGNKGTVSAQNTSFYFYTTTERTVFKIVTSALNVPAALEVLRDSVFRASFYAAELIKCQNLILQQLEDEKRNNKEIFNKRMLDLLYVQDHAKLEVLGNPETVKNIDLSSVKKYYRKDYVPNNVILTIAGNIDPLLAREKTEDIFKSIRHGEFDPDQVTKIHPMHPVAYSKQFVLEDTVRTPEFEVCWQFPGTGAARQASYSAQLINAMLNDKNNFIQIKAAKMGCKKLNIQYEANLFNGILRISFQPSKQNLFSTYQFIVHELSRLDKTLFNEETINVAKLEFRSGFAILKKSKAFSDNVAKSWNYNDYTYFQELSDSVFAVTQKSLRAFIIDYLDQEPHVSGLKISKADRESLMADTAFTDLDEAVGRYIFRYKQNVTDLEGSDNELMQRNLLQWLKINDDISVQVNGFSDEHEYNRVSDDTVIRFIDSIPTFFKSVPDIIKKGYLSPDMMRAMKIIKYLNEHGIDVSRLSGTSMMFKSNNKAEEKDNLKCTITLNKYHKSPSLYEYHYGRKKR